MNESRILFLQDHIKWNKKRIEELRIDIQSWEETNAKLEEELQRLQNNKEHV